jgi:hypothetical protein
MSNVQPEHIFTVNTQKVAVLNTVVNSGVHTVRTVSVSVTVAAITFSEIKGRNLKF